MTAAEIAAFKECVLRNLNDLKKQNQERVAAIKVGTKDGTAVVQPSTNLNELYVSARALKPQFDHALNDIGLELGIEVITPELKDIDRSTEKVKGKLQGDASALTDLLRATATCDTVGQISKAEEMIAAKFPKHRFRNRFEYPKSNGYRDIQALVWVVSTDPQIPSHWAEIQIQFGPLYEAKIKKGDALYHQWRSLEEAGTHRELTHDEKDQIVPLKLEEKELYDEIWSNATTEQTNH